MKLVTDDAGSVVENVCPVTVIADCCAKSNVADVTKGVTTGTDNPVNPTTMFVGDPFTFNATTTRSPVLVFLNAVIDTPLTDPVVPTRT